jgi:hypothetical protein
MGFKDLVRNGSVTTNSVESHFHIFQRGIKGVYQTASKKHPQRCAAEFALRYSNQVAVGVNDRSRADVALSDVAGKRLTHEEASLR